MDELSMAGSAAVDEESKAVYVAVQRPDFIILAVHCCLAAFCDQALLDIKNKVYFKFLAITRCDRNHHSFRTTALLLLGPSVAFGFFRPVT